MAQTPVYFFEDWCVFRSQLAEETQHTVTVLLEVLGTEDCIEASRRASTLTLLNLNARGIQDLRPLATLPLLRELTLQNNQITDLKPLEALTNVRRLYQRQSN